MPRRKITYSPGSFYHMFNRGTDRRSIFCSDDDFRRALSLMKRYCTSLQVTVIAYCLLPNHYHWLVRQDGPVPAGLLPQRVFNAYVKSFNNANGRSGTLFEDRYQAIPVATDAYLRHLCCYIHANAVRHGMADAVSLWPYSNYLDWVGARRGTMLDHRFIADTFGSLQQYQDQLKATLNGRLNLPRGLQDYLDEL